MKTLFTYILAICIASFVGAGLMESALQSIDKREQTLQVHYESIGIYSSNGNW